MKTSAWVNWCASLLVAWAAGMGWVNAQQLIAADPAAIKTTFSAHKANCFFFFVEDCPVSMRDFGLVGELRARYDSMALQLIAVYVGANGAHLQAIADSIGMPLLYTDDSDHRLVAMAQARVTPEYFLFDAAGKLRYRGAIDDYAIGLAKHKRLANAHFLSDAVAALIAGQAVPTKVTRPVGCVIERNIGLGRN